MTGTVVMLHNPFRAQGDREVIVVAEPRSIRDWLDEQGIEEFDHPTICLRNASPVLRGRWDDTFIAENDLIVFVPLPQGGVGGGKNPLRTILMLAVMVAAPYLGGLIAGAIGVTSTIGVSLITAGVALVGTTLVNVLLPPPKPAAPSFGKGVPSPSPTYSLTAQGNQARLTQPIPVVYGRHRVFPDLAATPWAEYDGNEQYLHQLHCIGQGAHEVEQIRIEDTPIASFEEIETETVPPGGAVTLFETDVVTAPEIAGQELIGVNDREEGKDGWVGPFTANPAGTRATEIGIDVVMPRGLYYAADDGSLEARTVTWEVEARAVDDDGAATGGWIAVASESVTAAENTPQRRSYRYSLDAGRYEVRVGRTNDKSGDARAGHVIHWGGLKAFLEDAPAFGAVTLLAVRMRATDNLSQRSARMINCIVTRKLPVWDPEAGWSEPPGHALARLGLRRCRQVTLRRRARRRPHRSRGAPCARCRLAVTRRPFRCRVRPGAHGMGSAHPHRPLRPGAALPARGGPADRPRRTAHLAGGAVRAAEHRQGQLPRSIRHARRRHGGRGDGDLLLGAHLDPGRDRRVAAG